MSLHTWDEDKSLGKVPCSTPRQSWQCPNMKSREDDRDMTGDNYDCKVCGRHIWLDYEEMK